MNPTDQLGVAWRKGCECVQATVGDKVAWKASPMAPSQLPPPKSHLHLSPSSTPSSSSPPVTSPPSPLLPLSP